MSTKAAKATKMRNVTEVIRHKFDEDSPYRLLVDSVRDYAIVTLDPSGNVTTWNKGAELIKGYRPEEIIGRHFSCFYSKEKI